MNFYGVQTAKAGALAAAKAPSRAAHGRSWWGLVQRVGPCWGVTLFRWGRRKLELWLAPADYAVAEHTHEDSDSEITILYAKPRRIYRRVGDRVDEYVASSRKYFGRWFSVRAGVPHAFDKGESRMLFLNWQTYLPGRRVTSVATDFKKC